MSSHQTIPGEKPSWLDDPSNVKKIIRWFLIGCVVCVALDLVRLGFPSDHSHDPYYPKGIVKKSEHFPTFFCIYGWAACVLLVLAAKVMRKLLMRSEDYYDV